MIINVCDVSILCRNEKSHKEFRKDVTEWLKANYLNKSFTNIETGIDIYINMVCLKKITSVFGEIKAHSFTVIQSMIENANFVQSEDDYKDRPDLIKVLRFETIIEVHGNKYSAWLYIKQYKEKAFFYSLNIAAQKML